MKWLLFLLLTLPFCAVGQQARHEDSVTYYKMRELLTSLRDSINNAMVTRELINNHRKLDTLVSQIRQCLKDGRLMLALDKIQEAIELNEDWITYKSFIN